MSGFFQCYYCYSDSQQDVADSLSNAGIHGFAFSPLNHWVQFTIDDQNSKLNEVVLRKMNSLFVHLVYAEDHGWEYQVCENNKLISTYSCRWDYTVTTKTTGSIDWLFTKLNLDSSPINHLLFPKPNDIMLIYNNCPHEQFCKLVGLRSIESISNDFLNEYLESYLAIDPGIITF